jgi:hypothetical protein
MLCASISSGAIDATYTKLYEFATQPVVKWSFKGQQNQ